MSTPSVIYVSFITHAQYYDFKRPIRASWNNVCYLFSCFFLVEGVPGMPGKRGDQGKPGRHVSYLGVNVFSAEH